MRLTRYAFIVLALLVLNLQAESIGYKRWHAYRESLKQDSGVARYYTFEDIKDSRSVIPDLKGGAELRFLPFVKDGKVIDDLEVIEGRVPEKTAVRLDRGWYQGTALDIQGKQFTFSCWFRRQGAGSIPSASMVDEGRIVSSAGWERGWCIATVYDEANTLRFCLGKPGGSENVMSDISVPDNVWHHLAATWDGEEMLLYLNGILVGKKEYTGSYTPCGKGDVLRIGNGGNNTGSVVLDIDEAVIYNRALSRKEIRGLGEASNSPANEILAAADKYIERGDYAGARREYDKLKELKSVEYGREIALFNIAGSYRLEKDYDNAHKTYKEIFSLPDLTTYYRIYGLFRQAEVYAEQKEYNNARKLYSDIVKTKGVLDNHIFRAELYTGDTYRTERKYGQARSIYERLLKEQDSSSYPHENYRLELSDRLEALNGLKDGQAEKSKQEKRAEWVNSPKYGIYVSLEGKDTNPGTKERPFATINRAQEEVRRIKKERGMPEGGITVYLRGGKYFITESIVFEEEDSGTGNAPVVYRSYPGEEARIIGGKQLTNFKPLTDPDILRRLPVEAKNSVWVSDLKEAGIRDYGYLRNRGASAAGNLGAMELFYNTKPMQLSRWPDEGWLFVADLVTPGGDGGTGIYTFQKGRFRYSGDRPKRWAEENDIWAIGYFDRPWDKIHTSVLCINTENRIVNLAPDIRRFPGSRSYGMPVCKGKPYYFYNILGEISKPGEFYIDRDTGKLYFYPPDKMEGSELIVSTLKTPIIEMRGVSNMVLLGLTLEVSWGNAVEMKDGINNLITGSVIRNTGQNAVNIKDGWENGVVGCDIYDTGDGGVLLNGGNWEKLIPAGHYVENNHIYMFNRFDGGYRPAVGIMGIGQRVSHNLISDSPQQGLYFNQNNHIIEYNEIYDVTHECKDAGAIYLYGAPKVLVNRGDIIRYNFIHHITEHSSPLTTHLLKGIYIDALNAGVTMTGNVLYCNTDRGIYTHGPDTRVENNILVDNRYSIHHINRSSLLSQPLRIKQWEDNCLDRINYRQPPWVTYYPQLRDILKHEKGKNIGWPKNVMIERNVNTGGQFLYMAENLREGNTIRNNIDGYDPLFVDVASMDFRIRAGSPVYGITGCDPVPFEKIGLYEDVLRASWPPKRTEAGKYYKPEKLESLPPARAQLGPLPFINKPVVYNVEKRVVPVKIDGSLDKKEWPGLDERKAIIVEKYYSGEDKTGDRSYVWMAHDDKNLYIAVENTPNPFKPGMEEREKQLATVVNELTIEGIHNEYTWWWQQDIDIGPIYIFWGHSDGRFEIKNSFSMPHKVVKHIREGIEYKSVVIDSKAYHWTAEWKIPFEVLNIQAELPDTLRFNIGVAKRGGWFVWVPTGGSVWRVDNAGILKFVK